MFLANSWRIETASERWQLEMQMQEQTEITYQRLAFASQGVKSHQGFNLNAKAFQPPGTLPVPAE